MRSLESMRAPGPGKDAAAAVVDVQQANLGERNEARADLAAQRELGAALGAQLIEANARAEAMRRDVQGPRGDRRRRRAGRARGAFRMKQQTLTEQPAFCANCILETPDLERVGRHWLCPGCRHPAGALRIFDVESDRRAATFSSHARHDGGGRQRATKVRT